MYWLTRGLAANRVLGELPYAAWCLAGIGSAVTLGGKADRAVQKLKTGSRAEMTACFERMSPDLEAHAEHGISYGYARRREPDRYPAVEEFFVIAPATVESKTRYGFDWFEAKWRETLGETAQERLFD